MALNIYKTQTMLAAIKQMIPARTFLRDRYFPTNGQRDIFPTEDVLVEYKDGDRKMAPVVYPRKGGILMERSGYETKRYTPPLVAPKRPLTIDDLNKKGFGENLFSTMTPAQRQAQILGDDLADFDAMHARREEYIAAQCMLNNGYVLKQYMDEYGGTFEEYEIHFYDGGANPSIYEPGNKWDTADADIMGDLAAMIRMLSSHGLPATDLVCSPDVGQAIINNEKIQTMLNIRNYNVGTVAPMELPDGVSRLCVLNVEGRNINVFSYDEQYEDEAGKNQLIIPSGKCVLSAPNAGRSLYGAVTQLEQEDGLYHTYMGTRVPKYTADADNEIRTLKVSSRPLLIPNNKNPWVSADVLTA